VLSFKLIYTYRCIYSRCAHDTNTGTFDTPQVLLPARVSLSWSVPALRGIAQAIQEPVSPSQCLSLMKHCTIPLSHGDKVPISVAFLSEEKVGVPPAASVWIVDGYNQFEVRVWTGNVRETVGHVRPEGIHIHIHIHYQCVADWRYSEVVAQVACIYKYIYICTYSCIHIHKHADWQYPEVIAKVKIHPGEYTLLEMTSALEMYLRGAQWSGGYIRECVHTYIQTCSSDLYNIMHG
jgi:hypothetical protein